MVERAVNSQDWDWAASSCGQNQSRPVRRCGAGGDGGCGEEDAEGRGSDGVGYSKQEGGGEEEWLGGPRGRWECTEVAIEGQPGDREDKGKRCLRGRKSLRERSGMRWCGGEEEREGGDSGRRRGGGRGTGRGMVGRVAGGGLREECRVKGSRAGFKSRGQGSGEVCFIGQQ
eukprot:scaffold16968_cov94-Amphora_coffeaeformis.AAC.4